ncbi:MAG: hypothetical protein PUE13_07280 [Clostridiales bacterium]|nr:hypothetical protein [Clostridiales bacterium]
MKVIIKILGFIVLCFLLVWGVSLGKCEILTAIHGDEFSELYKSNTMLGEQEYLKVLEYSDSSARVYYVGKDNSMANIICFVKREGQWEYDKWERCVWSKTGSASEVAWPYWWHFIYGGF